MDSVFKLAVEVSTKQAVADVQALNKEFEKSVDAAKKAGQGFDNALKGLGDTVNNLKANLGGLASGSVKEVGSSIAGLTTGMGALATGITGVVAAGIALNLALTANTNAIEEMADANAELADKMGLSLKGLETFKLIAAENSGSVEGLIAVYDKLSKALSKSEDDNLKVTNAFRRLGIEQDELAGKSKEQIAGVVIANFEALGRSAQATAATIQILGAGFRDQIPSIKEAAANFDDYQKRVEYFGAVVTPELVRRGGEQEKAFSNLALATKGLRIELAESFTTMTKDAASWAAEMVKSITDVLKEFRNVRDQAKAVEEVPQTRRNELFTQAKNETFTASNPNATFGDVNKRFKELLAAEIQARADIQQTADRELARFQRQATQSVKALPDLVKPEAIKQEKLTEEQKAIMAIGQELFKVTAEYGKLQAQAVESLDPVTQKTTELTYKIYELGKGYISLDQSSKIAAGSTIELTKALQAQATLNLRKNISSGSENLNNEIEQLKAQEGSARALVTLRQQLDKTTGKEFGLQTAEQLSLINKALGETKEKLDTIRDLKIGNSVTDSLKDLTEQSRLLGVELDNFWSSNRDTLNSTAQTLSNLYRQIDPEGRGKNITDVQKAQLEGAVKQIEAQKEMLEINKKIDSSFQSLGSAVSDWALGGVNAIQKVKIELIKLIALEGLKALGGSGSGLAGSFVNGLISGLGGRENGGYVSPGQTVVVGEKRPELFTAGATGGYVTPNVPALSGRGLTGGMIINVQPQLVVHGSIVNNDELQGMFNDNSVAIAYETKKYVESRIASYSRTKN